MEIPNTQILAQQHLKTNAIIENVINLQWRTLIAAVVLAFVTYKSLNALYNVTLHPLSHIPGPRLAAATYLVEFYYDVILVGRYTKQFAKMHERYGPIVRINPDEVHCNDINFIDEIYGGGSRKRDKPVFHFRGSSMNGSTFATVPHEHHRLRRSPIGRFFSRAQVSMLESDVHGVIQRLCDVLLAQSGEGKQFKGSNGGRPFPISEAYSCFTSDIISEYCFGRSWDFLSRPEFVPNYRRPFETVLGTTYVYRFLPFLEPLPRIFPWLGSLVYGDLGLVIQTRLHDIPAIVREVTTSPSTSAFASQRETIFGSVLSSDELPPEEKTLARITDEAISLLGGGTETVAWTLTIITYHLLTKPHLLARLTRELRPVVGDDPEKLPRWTTLEKLPYLSAVISEGLRLSYGVPARTSRVARDEDLIYRGTWMKKVGAEDEEEETVEYVIPRGMAMGMSPGVTHHDEGIFPNSHAFVPERWLEGNGEGGEEGGTTEVKYRRELEKALLSFSKGSRACLGINLAYCELYLAMAALTLRVFPRMRLFQSTEEDIRYDYDLVKPMVARGSKGVRVTIT